MGASFYDRGCSAVSPWKWPVVAVRWLLRRVQRPFFFGLQTELDVLRALDSEHATGPVSRRAYDFLLTLYRENQRHLEALRRSALMGTRVA